MMHRLSNHKLTMYLQILYNEASAEYKRFIKKKWKINYQLVNPNTHRSNAAEQAIRKFKAHFKSIMASVASCFQQNL